MTDAIKAALDVAGEAVRVAMLETGRCTVKAGCDMPPCLCARELAKVSIAAFLRALPDQYSRGGGAFWDAIPPDEETRLWIADAVERAGGGDARGERHGLAKLTDEIVRQIREVEAPNFSALSRVYGVHEGTIKNAHTGRTWRHV